MRVVQSTGQVPIEVVDAAGTASALIDPARIRILSALREPDSAAGVARALGLPRQRVGHHVRALEAAGLLTCIGERRKRNCVERLLRATARSYVLAPQLLGRLGTSTEEAQDRFSSTSLLAAATCVLQEVSTLRPRAEAAGKRLPTLTLQTEVRFASARSQSEFLDELLGAFTDVIERHHRPDATSGRTFRISLFGHPALPPAPATSPPEENTP
ncbi:MAG: ArsR/SmtB family transcription factor [Myxococcaceae bacterium]